MALRELRMPKRIEASELPRIKSNAIESNTINPTNATRNFVTITDAVDRYGRLPTVEELDRVKV